MWASYLLFLLHNSKGHSDLISHLAQRPGGLKLQKKCALVFQLVFFFWYELLAIEASIEPNVQINKPTKFMLISQAYTIYFYFCTS